MEKKCSYCHETKNVSLFYRDRTKRDELASQCKKCQSAAQKIYRKMHSNKIAITQRRGHLRRAYGLTKDDYEILLDSQNSTCAICGKPPNGTKVLYVDHNHITGQIRGLLCTACNTWLGHIKDNPNTIQKAHEYLTK